MAVPDVPVPRNMRDFGLGIISSEDASNSLTSIVIALAPDWARSFVVKYPNSRDTSRADIKDAGSVRGSAGQDSINLSHIELLPLFNCCYLHVPDLESTIRKKLSSLRDLEISIDDGGQKP